MKTRALLLAACGLLALSACSAAAPTPSADPPATIAPSSVPSATPSTAPSVSELSHAVVYIEAIDTSGSGFSGSGTLISPQGLILTNAHVAAPFDDGRDYDLSVGLTADADQRPEPSYHAELLAADPALDLALIIIRSDLEGNAIDQPFPYLPMGDSDAVQIGDEVQILGYPSIGGGTITYTSGQVSGFTGDALLGDRSWIKTDATIAGGNSGGLAANAAGELIAVPTQASASTDGPIVDCRIITDTNGDESVDEHDSCVPIGGFLNGLRPVAFAADMIEAVSSGVAYEPIGGLEQPDEEQPDFVADDVVWQPAVMTTAVDEQSNTALDQVESVPSGTNRLCAVWEYANMQPGMDYDAVWMVNGEIDPEISYLSQTWAYTDEGNFWICTYAEDEAGLADGFYVAAIVVEDEQQASGWAYIGDEYAPVDWSLVNNSSADFCYVYLSPTAAPGWGPDRLGSTGTLPPGTELDLQLPEGDYDIAIDDCNGEPLYEDSVSIVAGGSLELGD